MPHMILEISENVRETIDGKALLHTLQKALSESGPYALQDTKSRIIRHAEYEVADGSSEYAFVHLTLRILEGRTQEMINAAASNLRAVLEKQFEESLKSLKLSLTIEVVEMPKRLYFK